jgi:hypothetical protein
LSLKRSSSKGLEPVKESLSNSQKVDNDAKKEQAKITEQKLPSISKKAEMLIEVEIPKKLDRPSTSSVRNRLEQSKSATEKNAQAIQRKQELAEERRLVFHCLSLRSNIPKHQQGKKLRKAREDTALVEERRNKIKDIEDKKADQLRRIMVEKKKQAEAKKAQIETEREKRYFLFNMPGS